MSTPRPPGLRFAGLRPGDLVRLLSPASYLAVPLGTPAHLDADAGTLTVQPAAVL